MPHFQVGDRLTIQSWLVWAAEQLSSHSDSPQLDARILLSFIADLTDVELITKTQQCLPPEIEKNYASLIAERVRGVPVAYLLGQKDFWTLTLKVNPHTLIPRPETELLVETALPLVSGQRQLEILDLGTGTGAIALAIASERADAQLTATDCSQAALEVAEINAKANNINNVRFVRSDWFEDLPAQCFDLIISNPPYIAPGDLHLSQGDVRFEPKQALVSSSQGLADLRQIIAQSTHYLNNKGWLLVEHGYDQRDSVEQLFNEAGFDQVKNIIDLNQQPRVTLGQLTA